MKTKDIKKKVAAKVEKAKAKVAAKCCKAAKCAALLTVLAVAMTGCVNCYTRCPGTGGKVTDVYQSTKLAAGASCVVSFPQLLSGCPNERVLQWSNIMTVPLGIVVACDAVAEAAVDTICFPADWVVSKHRQAKGAQYAE